MSVNHCPGCGDQNPATDDGYTECCGQPTCSGWVETWQTGTFGADDEHIVTGTVRGCCPAVAQGSIAPGLSVLSRIS